MIQWFADRADLIIIMFDAHKLDISDELRVVMDALRIHQDKIRILLNKADQIDSQQLMRIYGVRLVWTCVWEPWLRRCGGVTTCGTKDRTDPLVAITHAYTHAQALMWSLGKVVNTPEVCRVYIGSFWEYPLQNTQNRFLLEREKQDLLSELGGLPQNAVVRRINELVKRARSVKVHAYLIHYLRKQVPTVFGKSEKQDKLIANLDREFVACARCVPTCAWMGWRVSVWMGWKGDTPNLARTHALITSTTIQHTTGGTACPWATSPTWASSVRGCGR